LFYYCEMCALISVIALCFAVDDLVKNYRQSILKAVKRSRTNPRLRRKLRPPVDILNIDARLFAEQLTFIDAVSASYALL